MKRSVVLLHGWGMRAAFWRGICAQLADFHVLTPDLPGYGAAPAPSPYALDAVVDVLAGAVPEEVDLVGWSLGGTIAMHWAATHPEQVRRLVLIAATPRFVGHAEWAHGVSPAVFRVFGAQLQRDPAALMQRFCVLQAKGEAQPETVAARLYEQHAQAPEAVLRESLVLLGDADLRHRVRGLHQPTLVMHATHDAVTSVGAAYWLADTLPHATLQIYDGGGHALPLTRAEDCAARIASFLNE